MFHITIRRLSVALAITIFAGASLWSCGGDNNPVNTQPGPPSRVEPVGGEFFFGLIGADTLDRPLNFRVTDSSGTPVPDVPVRLSLVEGDGLLLSDSLVTDSNGVVTSNYAFSGSLGHAVVQAKIGTVDSTEALLRANTLIPGVHGQGQYVLFDDSYATVQEINGTPESDDPDPRFFLQYVVYESAKGVVVMVTDTNQNEQADPFEPVEGVIVNTVYSQKIADSIGIGSTLGGVAKLYGLPDSSYSDPTPPPATVWIYKQEGLTFFANPSDQSIIEIHLTENATSPVSRYQRLSTREFE